MSRKVFFQLGVVLLAWAAVNTLLFIGRYGIGEGHYWWFCNLALMGMGWGLVREDRGLITGFVAIASYTQTFWLLDNLSVLFGGTTRFGLVEYLYAPGYPLDEFVLAHYHYFTIPIGIAAMVLMPAGRDYAVRKVLVWNPIIFGVSYFAFGADQNVNCIHRSCFPGSQDFAGPLYSFFFWLLIYVVHIALAYGLEAKLLPAVRKLKSTPKLVSRGVVAVSAVFAVLFAFDVRMKAEMPRVTCAANTTPEDTASVSCHYVSITLDHQLLVNYRALNPSSHRVMCKVAMEIDGETTELHEELPVEAFSQAQFAAEIANPEKSVQVKIAGLCREADPLTAMNDAE